MSHYFRLEESVDEKIIGSHYPQCAGVLDGYNDEYENQYSLYFFAHKKGKKINYQPDLSAIKLFERTKLTDLISCGMGPGNDLVISSKFKDILEECATSQYQLFETTLNKKREKFRYWWVHFVYNLEKVVDFEASMFFHSDEKLAEKVKKIKDYKVYKEFYDKDDTYGLIRAKNTVLKHRPLDFFMVGQFNQTHYVSEKLMNRIINEGVTGLYFEEANDIQFR